MATQVSSADAEYKILEELATWLTYESSGTVALYSERPICPSCQSVIQQFQEGSLEL
jgi:hypothetical protein